MPQMRVLADGRLWYNIREKSSSASVIWSLDADRRLVLDKCDNASLCVSGRDLILLLPFSCVVTGMRIDWLGLRLLCNPDEIVAA